MEIKLKDGRQISRRLDRVIGSPRRPMTDEDLSSKFLGNVTPLLGAQGAEAVRERCMNLEELDQTADLIELLKPTGEPGRWRGMMGAL